MSKFLSKALILSASILMAANSGFAKDCRLTVYFGLDRADLTPEMQGVLLSFLAHNPRASGSVIGHTDAPASQEYNMDLSMRRAMTVVNFIEQFNANSVSLATDWRGKMNLVVNTPHAEVLNRRVEIYYHNCTPVTLFTPLPVDLRGYVDMDGGPPQQPGSSGSSASAGSGGSSSSSSSTGSGASASASAGASGSSATSSGSGSAAGASAGQNGTSATSSGSTGGASASAGPGGTSASSSGSGGGSSAAAGGGSSSSSSAGG